MALTESQIRFIGTLADAGSDNAAKFGIPLLAIVACGCLESGYGTSAIYNLTNCPFNLQRPSEWKYPVCSDS